MKAAIYCRLSEEDRNKTGTKDDSNSIRNQKSMLLQYAHSQNWEIYDIYSDDDYTGADRGRPQFRRMLADAEERRFDIILCKTQSRFTRELELVEKYIHGLFPVWGIRFVSIVDNADTDNKGNKKSRQINGLVNEWYLEDLSENIRSVLTSRREQGFHIGAFAPYGYQKDPVHKGRLIIDEGAARVVREIFSLAGDGYGNSAIAKILNERGIPNPTEYKRQMGLRYSQSTRAASPLWKYHSVHWILSNEAYIGNLVQGKSESVSYKTKQLKGRPRERWIRVEGTHTPIVEEALWKKVQQNRVAHARSCKGTGKVHLFSGLAVCRHCGYSLRLHRGKNGRCYLQCETRHIAADACPGAFIPETELEQIILRELKGFHDRLLDRKLLEKQVDIESADKRKMEKYHSEITRLQQKAEECSGAIRQLYADKAAEIITLRDFQELSTGFQKEKARYESMIEDWREQIRQTEEGFGNRDNRLAVYLQPEHLSRSIATALLESIRVGKRSRVTGTVPVEITWKF